MKHIGKTVKELVEAKGIKKLQFAKDIDLAPESLSRFFKHSTIQCELLDKICRILEVSPSFFFDEPDAGHQATAQASTVIGNASANAVAQSAEAAALRELLAEKERTIQILLGKIGTKTGQDG